MPHGLKQQLKKQFIGAPLPYGRAGFTLLEVLVILTLLGFLIAMLAPRFGGIVSATQATATQQNLTDMINYTTVNLQNYGKYPSGTVNIVSVDSSGTYHRPMISDQNPDNGAEVIAHALNKRNYYNLMLPRLLATEQRLENDNPLAGTSADGGDISAYAVEDKADSADLATAISRTVNVYDRQPEAFFTIMDAQGATRPNGETVDWSIDFNGDGTIE